MKDWNIKEDKAQNAIYLKEDNGGKGRFFRARFLQAGLVKYSFGVCLLKKETIDKFVYGFVGCPVVIDHKDVSDKNAKDLRVGVISKVEFEQFDGWYWCEGVIFDQEAIDLVNNGYNVSCQYEITQYATNERKELHNGNEYDKEILDGAPEHLAIVKNPRYESAMIAVNAIDLTASNDKWITVHPNGEDEEGRPLLIKEGEDVKDAMKRQWGAGDDQLTLDLPGAKEAKKDARTHENKKQAAKEKLFNAWSSHLWESDTKQASKKTMEALEEYNKYHEEKIDMDDLDDFVERYEEEKDNEKNKAQVDEYNRKNKEKKDAEKKENKDKDVRNFGDYVYTVKTNTIDQLNKIKKEQGAKEASYEAEDKLEYIKDKYKQYAKDMDSNTKRLTEETIKQLESFVLNKASNSFIEQFKDTLYTVLAEGITNRLGELIASNEERWITVHPHGDDSEDYRRLKLQDGESPKEAIDRVFKKEEKADKKEKSEAELKAEKKQLYQDILTAKKKDDKETHRKLLERYREIERLLNGEEKNKKNEDKQTENKPQKKSKHFEKYNKIADEANKLEKIWRDKGDEQKKLIDNNAEYQKLEKEEEKLKDERSKLNYSTDKARWHQLSQEINDIYGLKENIRKDISSKIGIREAQEAYLNKSVELTNEKVEVIKNSSEKIAERLKDNTKTDKILKELSSLSKEEYLNYKNQEIEYRKQYDALSEKLVKYSYGTPEYDSARKEKSEMYDKYLKAKGSASKIHYDFAVKVGKILQVKNGVKLSTEVSSSKMNDVVEKLHNCFDGVVPSTVFNNTTMNVRANGGRAYQQGQSIHISSNEKMGTAIHETMHHIEENSAEVLINSLSFAKYRTGEERQRSLKNLTGLSYKANEVCKPDKFFNPYCGKLYNFGGGRNQTFEKGTASEIMSMGVQRIFEDPLNFAKDDREYFNFVLMNLRGELWD